MDIHLQLLINSLTLFAADYGIAGPKSNDIKSWWKQALLKMDTDQVNELFEIFEIPNKPNRILQFMRNEIIKRRQALHVDFCRQ